MSSLLQPHSVVLFSRSFAFTCGLGRTLLRCTFYVLIFTQHLSLLYFCIVNASLNTNSYLCGCSSPSPSLFTYSLSRLLTPLLIWQLLWESFYMRCMEMAPVSIWAAAPRLPHHYMACSVIKLSAHLCCNKSIQVSAESWLAAYTNCLGLVVSLYALLAFHSVYCLSIAGAISYFSFSLGWLWVCVCELLVNFSNGLPSTCNTFRLTFEF